MAEGTGSTGGGVLRMSLMCAVCLQKLKNPRCLPCVHTFCMQCLQNHISNFPRKELVSKGLPCPVCRSLAPAPKPKLEIAKWAENYPVNHLVNTLMEMVPTTSEHEFCDPCKSSGESKVALHWCNNCSESLCDECARVHKSMKATKTHSIDVIEKARGNPQQTMVDDIFCNEHHSKKIEFYCEDHEVPCCSVCVANTHRKCDSILPIEQVVNDENKQINLDTLMKEIEEVSVEADKLKRERQEVSQSVQRQKKQLLLRIAETKMKIIQRIEKLEAGLISKFTAIQKTDAEVVDGQVAFCATARSSLDHSKVLITAAQEQGSKSKSFIAQHQAKQKLVDYKEGLETVKDNAAKLTYSFKEDPTVVETIDALKSIGKFDVIRKMPNADPPIRQETTFILEEIVPEPESPAPDEEHTVRKVKNISVKGKSDKKDCVVTSMQFVPEKRILLADNANCKIKLFEEAERLVSSLSCSNAPWDFAFYQKENAAVTFPNEKRIKLVTVTDTITANGFIKLKEKGTMGICMVGEDIALTCSYGVVKIIAIDGTEKLIIDTDFQGKTLFSNPEFVEFNNFSDTLYISDFNNHSVTALKYRNGEVDGHQRYVYTISGPKGINVDPEGFLYVCSHWSNDVHQVNENGILHKILIRTLSHPTTISFAADGRKFALAEKGLPNQLQIFKRDVSEEKRVFIKT